MRSVQFLLAACVTSTVGCAPRVTPESPLQHIAVLEDQRAGGSGELAALTRHPDPAVRARAVLAVARIQDPADLAVLRQAQSDADEEVAQLAVWGIGQLGLAVGNRIPGAAVEAVAAWLPSDDPTRVVVAVEALGKLATVAAETAILSVAEAPSAEVRAAVADALFRRRFAPRWRREVAAEPDASPAAAAALRALLGDIEAGPRRAAAHALSRLADPVAVDSLVPLLADSDEWTRFFTARAIARAGSAVMPATLDALAIAAQDVSPRVRREAVAALVELGAVDRLPLVVANDAAAPVRSAFATGLGSHRDPEAESLLVRLEAEDPAPSVRTAALAALARRGGATAEERLRARLADPLAAIRSSAVAALAGLPPAQREQLGAPALADPDRSVRLRALETLGDLPMAAGAVTAALASGDIAERGTAVDLITAGTDEHRAERLRQVFANSTGAEWIELREAIVEALAEDPELLLEAGSDPAPAVRMRALAALRRAGHPEPSTSPTELNEPSPFLDSALPRRPRVEFQTSRGGFVIEGLDEVAPLHVASLLALVDRGFYDGLTIHRVVPGFVVQGGDPRGDGWGGPEFQLRDEVSRVPLDRGMVGMAKAGKDTGGSQFFVTLAPTPHLDGNYTVYGRIVQGMEVIDQLEVGDRIERARRLTTPD